MGPAVSPAGCPTQEGSNPHHRHPLPSSSSNATSPLLWLQLRRVEPFLTTRGEGMAKGNQQCFELGLSWETWCCRDLSVCTCTGGKGLDCEARHTVSRQEIKWQATLQASVGGWWEASPSLLDYSGRSASESDQARQGYCIDRESRQ